MTKISSSHPPSTHTAPSSTKPDNAGKPNKTDDPDEPNNNKKKKDDENGDTSPAAANDSQSAIAEAIRAQEEQMLMQIYQRNKPKQLDIPKSKDEGEDEDDDVPTMKLR